jgi:hypothetical protein
MEKDWASNPLDGRLLVSEVDDEERKGRSFVKGDSLDDILFVLVLLLDDALCWAFGICKTSNSLLCAILLCIRARAGGGLEGAAGATLEAA